MDGQVNPRTQRAHDALIDAVIELASKRPVKDISLTEVAEAAQVSRPTVYKIFQDVPSLAAAAAKSYLDEVFARIDEQVEFRNTREYLDQLMEIFVSMIYEHVAFVRNAMYGPSSGEIAFYAIDMIDARMRDHFVGQRIAASGKSASGEDILAGVSDAKDAEPAAKPQSVYDQRVEDERLALSAGVVWILVKWLASDFKGENEPKRMAKRMADVLYRFSGARDE